LRLLEDKRFDRFSNLCEDHFATLADDHRVITVSRGFMLLSFSRSGAALLSPWRIASRALATQRFPVPTMGDSITEGTLLSLHKKVGDYVAIEELLAMVETDKVTVEVRAPASGTIKALFYNPNDNVLVGADLVEIDVGAGGAGAAATAPASAATTPPPKPAAAASPPPPPSAPSPAAAAIATSVRLHPGGRPSLIKFPPRGAAAIAAAKAKPVAASAAAALPLSSRFEDGKPSPPGTITFAELPKRFRPKPLSKEEIEAVEMGGAGYTW
jgi:pyruvate/2-oxoglutarate dehydrogenase complex dihydrolipoamide acyltransferase (E2) component